MKDNKYTQKEISKKINNLTIMLRCMYSQRTDINEQIREQLKNIKYWSDIDLNQFKIFKE